MAWQETSLDTARQQHTFHLRTVRRDRYGPPLRGGPRPPIASYHELSEDDEEEEHYWSDPELELLVLRIYPCARDPEESYPCTRDPEESYPCARDPEESYPCARDPEESYPCARDREESYPCVRDSEEEIYPCARDPEQIYPCARDSEEIYPCARDSEEIYPCGRDSEEIYPCARDPEEEIYPRARDPEGHIYSYARDPEEEDYSYAMDPEERSYSCARDPEEGIYPLDRDSDEGIYSLDRDSDEGTYPLDRDSDEGTYPLDRDSDEAIYSCASDREEAIYSCTGDPDQGIYSYARDPEEEMCLWSAQCGDEDHQDSSSSSWRAGATSGRKVDHFNDWEVLTSERRHRSAIGLDRGTEEEHGRYSDLLEVSQSATLVTRLSPELWEAPGLGSGSSSGSSEVPKSGCRGYSIRPALLFCPMENDGNVSDADDESSDTAGDFDFELDDDVDAARLTAVPGGLEGPLRTFAFLEARLDASLEARLAQAKMERRHASLEAQLAQAMEQRLALERQLAEAREQQRQLAAASQERMHREQRLAHRRLAEALEAMETVEALANYLPHGAASAALGEDGEDQAAPPASEDTIRRLPRVTVRDGGGGAPRGDESCPICCSEYVGGEVYTSLPCKHGFHRQCVALWLRKSGTCPVCRHVLSPTAAAAALPGTSSRHLVP